MCTLLTHTFCLMYNTQELDLRNNMIGDQGMTAFADAVGKGALASLEYLELRANAIGDVGITALATAVGSGALASLKTVVVDNSEHPALKAACKARGIGY